MSDLKEEVRRAVLENAVKYDGKPDVKSVMGALLGSRADLRSRATEVKDLVVSTVAEVSKMSPKSQIAELRRIAPELLEDQVQTETPEDKELPELPGLDKWDKVVMRMAPFPSGPLHIGNARMVVLNDYYVKRYSGELILVFDDTIGSAEKVVEPDAFDLIPEGLDYLNVEYHRTIYKSDRLFLFYQYAVDLINREKAYVCDCDAEVWRKLHKAKAKPCPCRSISVEENLARWEKMLDGTYPERAAAVRLKTGMDDPDPAMRDHVILRISETNHPRVGTRYRVWPLLEYSWGIDDHELGISHIVRGKDLVKEGKIEQHIWDIFEWKHPELLYYGRLRFQDAKLSKSKSRREVMDGAYSGWDDPRTWSLQSLKKRGIAPQAVRKAMLDLGLSIVDITVSMKSVYSENRKLRDADAPRAFLVREPTWIQLEGIPTDIDKAFVPVHPDFPERGLREIPIETKDGLGEFGLQSRDIQDMKLGDVFRLKDFANFRLVTKAPPSGVFHSISVDGVREAEGPIIHWIPKKHVIPVELIEINGSITRGLGEPSLADYPEGTFLQFERVGFGRIFETGIPVKVAFAHK